MALTNEMLVPTFKASGLTQEEFCKSHNITLDKLRYHLYKKKKSQKESADLFSLRAAPTFISFERQAELDPKGDKAKACTIIHGRFSIKELVSIIKELERIC